MLRRHGVTGAFWQKNHGDTGPSGRSGEARLHNAADPKALLDALALRPLMTQGDGPFSGLSHLEPGSPAAETEIERLVSRHLLDEASYADPFTGRTIDAARAVEILAGWRSLIEANRSIFAAFGFAHWKRQTIAPLLWNGHKPIRFLRAAEKELDRIPEGASIAIWKSKLPKPFLVHLERGPWSLVEVEDGFIRSAGLGADCVPPLSIIADDLGIYYDPARPSRLEEMLVAGKFSMDEMDRADELRQWIVDNGVSKYNVGQQHAPARVSSRQHILVVGQVEDDRSVQRGCGSVRTNLDLLAQVRKSAPDAYLVYRPHPDVEAGHRVGSVPRASALQFADAIDASSSINALITMVDEVHVMTSLTGFEALLRGKVVHCHGTPFYAGWGLTQDHNEIPSRRGAKRSLSELIAVALLRYPRYLDPMTGLPCTAEILVERLLSGAARKTDTKILLRQMQGRVNRMLVRLTGG
jgi:capsular polysaccharide export protein